MKKLFLSLIAILFINFCFGQLKLKTQNRIEPTEKGVLEFIKKNNFDFALMNWTTTNWLGINDQFCGFFKQNKKYYIAKIISTAIPPRNEFTPLKISVRRLKKNEATQLIDLLQLDSAFKYKQYDFDRIPEYCTYVSNGDTINLSLFDYNTFHLMKFSDGETRYLKKYAADYLLENCGPFIKEFKNLRGFVNSFQQLIKAAGADTSSPPASGISIQKR